MQDLQTTYINTNEFHIDSKKHLDKESKLPGCRVSPSQFETLSQLYENLREADETTFLAEINRINEIDNSKALENAQWSIYGTQMHYLTYFTQLFKRSEQFNRYPTYNDFKHTFPYRSKEYYFALLKIADLTDLENENPSQSYWNEWRMNGQDFTPANHTNYQVSPYIIKEMWENGTIPVKDINDFNYSLSNIPKDKLDPDKSLVINEVLSITNILFNDSNLQVPTVIDEICISKDFPKSPIQIIDYKTGKQFKEPEYKERVQIFLMMTAVLVNILDRAHTIGFMYNQWDISHDTRDFPFFTKNSLRNNLIGNVHFTQLLDCIDQYKELIKFSYINPLTQESIDIDMGDIYLDTQDNIKDMLMYLNRVNNFYIKHKEVIKKKLNSTKNIYTLPVFPIKNFDNDNFKKKEIQLSLL